MIGGLAITSSGLRHAGQRFEASVRNTASLVTERAAARQPAGREQTALRGVVADVSAPLEVRAGDDSVGPAVPPAPGSYRTSRHLEGAVEQVASARYFEALARVVEAQDDMLGQLVDLAA